MREFEKFDRELADLRDRVAEASMIVRDAVPRYVAMMQAIATIFLLYYEDMPNDDKVKMKTAFDELAATATDVIEEESESNVHPIRKPE